MGRPVGSKNKTSKSSKTTKVKMVCACGNSADTDFYKSDSVFFKGTGKIPLCKNCINELYKTYVERYKIQNCQYPEKKAVKRLCMGLDLYYNDDIFENTVRSLDKDRADLLFLNYIKMVKLIQYRGKTYDNTLKEEELKTDGIKETYSKPKTYGSVSDKTVEFFGSGFSNEDYNFLQSQYDDWTTRHECQTKSQEEVFKRLCFKQLEILKAQRNGDDTKDLDATFLKQLEAAKLQPKQNAGETMADNQSFGTLIDKWEVDRPLPEVDPDLKDVDKIGLYLDTFFRGHLAKMMGLKNGLSKLYDKYMEKYTVQKPEYDDDEDGEATFDAIFGNAMDDD